MGRVGVVVARGISIIITSFMHTHDVHAIDVITIIATSLIGSTCRLYRQREAGRASSSLYLLKSWSERASVARYGAVGRLQPLNLHTHQHTFRNSNWNVVPYRQGVVLRRLKFSRQEVKEAICL